MALLKCCVGGCSSTSETHRLFSFPKNERLGNLWMSFLVPTNSLLLGLSRVELLKKRVCSKHFDSAQFDEMGRRICFSYPSLFSDLEIGHDQPLRTEEWSVLEEHNYFQKRSDYDTHQTNLNVDEAADVSNMSPQPFCSFNRKDKEELIDHNYNQHTSLNAIDVPELHDEEVSAEVTCEQVPSSVAGPSNVSFHNLPTTEASRQSKIAKKTIKNIMTIVHNSSADCVQWLRKTYKVLDTPTIVNNYNVLPRYVKTLVMMQLKQVSQKKKWEGYLYLKTSCWLYQL